MRIEDWHAAIRKIDPNLNPQSQSAISIRNLNPKSPFSIDHRQSNKSAIVSPHSAVSVAGTSGWQGVVVEPPIFVFVVFERSRDRSRHGQYLRVRAREGDRGERAVHCRDQQGERAHRSGRQGREGHARPHAGQHRRDQADEGRRHRRLRSHREDAHLLHQEGPQPQRMGASAHRHRRAVGDHAGREARREGQRLSREGQRSAPR